MLEVCVADSVTPLKERDYIGLSVPSSGASQLIASSQLAEDAFDGTDLRLELGLGLGPATASAKKAEEGELKDLHALKRGSQFDISHGAKLGGIGSTASKKWMKRGFSETVADMPAFKGLEPDAALAKQSSLAPVWASSTSKGPAWGPVGPDATSSHTPANGNVHSTPEGSRNAAMEDAPPAKDRVVGWPPVRSYRRQALVNKPSEMFVKVNMDGITVGRKVDLNAYTSYESLLVALEEMFQPSSNASQILPGREHEVKHFLLASDSDFVLTYEDKDGDWMLVGDVPWSMFVSTVRRLRITRGNEASGAGTRALETSRLHA